MFLFKSKVSQVEGVSLAFSFSLDRSLIDWTGDSKIGKTVCFIQTTILNSIMTQHSITGTPEIVLGQYLSITHSSQPMKITIIKFKGLN